MYVSYKQFFFFKKINSFNYNKLYALLKILGFASSTTYCSKNTSLTHKMYTHHTTTGEVHS